MRATKTEYEFQYLDGQVDASPLWESHCHINFEMIAVVEGDISVVIEGRRFRCMANQIVILPPLTYHSVRANQRSSYRRLTALFDESAIPEAIRADVVRELKSDPVISHSVLPQTVEKLVGAVGEKGRERYMALAESLMVQIFYACVDRKDEQTSSKEPDEAISGVIGYIDDHICEKISLDEIAASLFVSKSTLCHSFKEKMKISVKQYIVQKKIALAAKMMRDGASAAEAAHRVGYENYSNFYRMYRKNFDVTPSGTKRE